MFIYFLISTAIGQTLNCMTTNLNETFSRGDHMSLCVHFIDANTANPPKRVAFNVQVDRYTAVNANGAYQQFKSANNMTISVQANKNYTPSPAVPYIINQTNVFPIFSLVIQMDSGNVTDLIWDDGCWTGSTNCYSYVAGTFADENNYVTDCGSATNTTCDPKIYVSFIGSDSKGNYMESSGKRMSQFRKYSLGSIFSSASGAFNNAVESAKSLLL